MPCGKRPLVKTWDKPKNLKVVRQSRYEKNEPSVKEHWKNIIRDIELSYKDDKFWENHKETVRKLVGDILFDKIAKIFSVPLNTEEYQPPSETASRVASDKFYISKRASEQALQKRPDFSLSDFEPSSRSLNETVTESSDELSVQWSEESQAESNVQTPKSSHKALAGGASKVASIKASRNFSRMISSKSFSQRVTSGQSVKSNKSIKSELIFSDSPAESCDDLDVHLASIYGLRKPYSKKNPHFDMLYCNESETDMIKWKSKYKQKVFEVSASDEFSKKAEILTKTIAKDFYDWWTALGSDDYKSEIKRPGDIEDLYQVWFDEHASRCVKLHPKILPCVLPSIADYVMAPSASCPNVLLRQIAFDIHAETSPAHTVAFNSSLPQKLKHIPPNNDTKTMWHRAEIPEDLRSMGAVWDDIQHLTSTKEFYNFLKHHPYMAMPPCFEDADSREKKQLFAVPSDYVDRERTSSSEERGLALPVSEVTLELKEVLSKLMT